MTNEEITRSLENILNKLVIAYIDDLEGAGRIFAKIIEVNKKNVEVSGGNYQKALLAEIVIFANLLAER